MIFAFLEAADSHRLYFYRESLFRWRHTDIIGEAINYEYSYSNDYLQLENFALTEASEIMQDLYSAIYSTTANIIEEATPTPTPTPTPEDPDIKQSVSTIMTFPENLFYYILTNNSDFYYIHNNQLIKQTINGTTSVIFDGDTDFWGQIEIGEAVHVLIEGTADKQYPNKEVLTADYLDLLNVFYDDKTDDVYFIGENAVRSGNYKYSNYYIYNINNLNKPVFKTTRYINSSSYSPSLNFV